MKTLLLKVEITEDDGKWSVSCPALIGKGMATWGKSKEDALVNLNAVLQMIAKDTKENGGSIIPTESFEGLIIEGSFISVNIED